MQSLKLDTWSDSWKDQYGVRPAYPNNTEPLDGIGNEPDGTDNALETAEEINPHNCPSSYRSFKCAGDGSSDDDDDFEVTDEELEPGEIADDVHLNTMMYYVEGIDAKVPGQ